MVTLLNKVIKNIIDEKEKAIHIRDDQGGAGGNEDTVGTVSQYEAEDFQNEDVADVQNDAAANSGSTNTNESRWNVFKAVDMDLEKEMYSSLHTLLTTYITSVAESQLGQWHF